SHADNVPSELLAGTPRKALEFVASSPDDPLVSHLAWRMMSASLDYGVVNYLAAYLDTISSPNDRKIAFLWPQLVDRLVASKHADGASIARVILNGLDRPDPESVPHKKMLDILTRAIRQGRLDRQRLKELREALQDHVRPKLADGSDPLQADYIELAGAWGDPEALGSLRNRLADPKAHPTARFEALEILVSRQDEGVLNSVAKVLSDSEAPT